MMQSIVILFLSLLFFIPRDSIHTNHIAAFCLINGT